jgi:hypothetical protein
MQGVVVADDGAHFLFPQRKQNGFEGVQCALQSDPVQIDFLVVLLCVFRCQRGEVRAIDDLLAQGEKMRVFA